MKLLKTIGDINFIFWTHLIGFSVLVFVLVCLGIAAVAGFEAEDRE